MVFTGTKLFFKPGLLLGGMLEHDCSQQRSVGYFLEPLILLAPFAKKPISITLRGITNGPQDPSVSGVVCKAKSQSRAERERERERSILLPGRLLSNVYITHAEENSP